MATRIGVSLIFVVIARIAWHGVRVQVRSGRTTFVGGDPRGISRERYPVTFWCHIIWDALVGAGCAAIAVFAAIGYFY